LNTSLAAAGAELYPKNLGPIYGFWWALKGCIAAFMLILCSLTLIYDFLWSCVLLPRRLDFSIVETLST